MKLKAASLRSIKYRNFLPDLSKKKKRQISIMNGNDDIIARRSENMKTLCKYVQQFRLK